MSGSKRFYGGHPSFTRNLRVCTGFHSGSEHADGGIYTAVVDLTDDLQDPVDLPSVYSWGRHGYRPRPDLLPGVITRPQDTVLVLVTDLYEGGDPREMRKKFVSLVNSGVQLIVLPALNDDGAPSYDKIMQNFWQISVYLPLLVRPISSPT